MDKQAKINLLIKKLFTLMHSTNEEELEELQAATTKLNYNKDLAKIVYRALDEMVFEESDETAICNYVVADIIENLQNDGEQDNYRIINKFSYLKSLYPKNINKIVEVLQKCLIERGDIYLISKMAQIAKYEDLFDASALFNALVDLDVEKVSACELIDII